MSPQDTTPPCDCIEKTPHGWVQRCDCQNSGDLASAEAWCCEANTTPPEAPKCIECGSERVVTDLGAMNGACPDCGNGRDTEYTLPPEASPVPCAKEIAAMIDAIVCHTLATNADREASTRLWHERRESLQSAIHAHAERRTRKQAKFDAEHLNKIMIRAHKAHEERTASAVSEATKPLVEALKETRYAAKMALFLLSRRSPAPNASWQRGFDKGIAAADKALASYAGSGEGEKCLAHEVCRGTSMRVRGCDCEACSPAPSGAAKEGS